MVGGQAGDTQVDHLPAHGCLNAAVLRDALLRDRHVALNFQPADDGSLQPLGWTLHLVQNTVDPITHAKALRQGLKVNI